MGHRRLRLLAAVFVLVPGTVAAQPFAYVLRSSNIIPFGRPCFVCRPPTLSVVNVATGTQLAAITLGANAFETPSDLVVSPDGARVYLLRSNGDTMVVDDRHGWHG